MNSRNLLITIVALIILGGLAFYLTGSQQPNPDNLGVEDNTIGQNPVGGGPGDATGSAQQSPVKEFTVEAGNFSFNPAEIRVNRGDTVRITLQNTNGFHDWVIDEFNARTRIINTGQTDTVEFVVDRTGSFEYYCSVGNHRQMGMVGRLIVQ